MHELSERQAGDFLQFEGNAQSLRLALRTARPSGPAGLNLCFATLGALVKYPCASTVADKASTRASCKKCGVLEIDECVGDVVGCLGEEHERMPLPGRTGRARSEAHR